MQRLCSRTLRTSLFTSTVAAALAASVAGCGVADDEATEAPEATASELASEELASPAARPLTGLLRTARPITGQYIVVLHQDELAARSEAVLDVAAAMTRSVDAQLLHSYAHALTGFAARMSEDAARKLLADPRVAFIEEDGEMKADATQTGATWGLDRIDQKERPLNGNYSYHTTGAGVHAYIIDTGMRLTHAEYAGRVGNGFDAVTPGGTAADCNGHGTHVAGTVGGTTYGVAKGAILHPVRVLDCNGSGSYAGVIAGVDWVTANRVLPAVANMSLGGGASAAVDAAVTNSIAAGVSYAVAAGNNNANACNFSPARTPNALTISATDASDSRNTLFSNYGTCVDLFAPGTSITSAWLTSDTATAALSGTSMAAPHVAGVAALYLERVPTATPAQVAAKLASSAVPGLITNPGAGTPNLLLHNGLFNISLRASSGHHLKADGGGNSHLAADAPAVSLWERFDIADLNGGALANNDLVNLRVSNGSYIVAEGAGGGVVNANRPVAGSWETLKLINLGGGAGFSSGDQVALQAPNGQYVVAENGGGLSGSGAVNANRDAIGAWEIFTITLH